jgi:Flp pilus assembly protein TadG
MAKFAERNASGPSDRDTWHGGSFRQSVARSLLAMFRGNSGVAAIEFAVLAPILFFLLVGACEFSMTLSNFVTLQNAVHVGARQMAIGRGDTTVLTDTKSQFAAASGNLNQASVTVSYSVNGTACTTDSTCSTALVAGVPATVLATYPCNLVVMGTNFAPNCTLSVGTTERVE